MATIKRAGNRIITKVVNGQRRVSCSCCPSEEGCCMYPAQAFYDERYTEDDLPNTLIINPFDLNATESVEVSRDGLIYGPYQFFEGYSQQVTIFENFENVGPRWVLEQTGVGVLDDSPCLFQSFSNGVEVGPAGITDAFADTYTVYVNGLADVFDETFLVIRRSLCVWSSDVDEGEPSGVVLTAPQSFSPKWVLAVADIGQAKDDPQNSPIGLYGNQGTEIS
jgi:hypothetical protein